MDAIRSHMEEIGGRALIHQKSETKGYGFELCLYLPKTHLLEDILESRTLSTSA